MTIVEFTTGTSRSQKNHGSHSELAAVGAADFPDGHVIRVAHGHGAVGEHNPPVPTRNGATPTRPSSVLAPNPWADHNGPLLALLADALADLERTRIAN